MDELVKYKAAQIENEGGQWGVTNSTGTKYYPSYMQESQEAAEREALILNMQHYYNMANDLYDKGVEAGLLDANAFSDYLI